ncbi:Delay of germination 1 [Dorcoceras hygrometricum]|uniref:Delay of germination 1 n=1 Tax=Dorcoceras hygrometricum TaxID=472368 RepID=A0A2Z7CXJ7_9LAMI|nr:Delay of germination 1 [Dorcoceras hygrometricum]
MGSNGDDDTTLLPCLYKEWMTLQEQELSDLLQHSLNLNKDDIDEEGVATLLESNGHNFEDYVARRRRLARMDVPGFFSQSWRTSFENSLSWMGGCRPSSYFRLIYALCGCEIESRLAKFAQDGNSSDFPLLSATQLTSIDDLQRKVIAAEDKLSLRLAGLQQEVADMPLALIARKSSPDYQLSEEAREAIGKIEEAKLCAIEEADELRLKTYGELMKILTPGQALDYVIAAKKLRLCVQAWGIEKDRERARE